MGRNVSLLRIALVFALIVVTVGVALRAGDTRSSEAAGAILDFPRAACFGNSADVSFAWLPVEGALEQWIDISVSDNNFASGTYTGVKLSVGQSSFKAAAVNNHYPHYWRVNTRTAGGWQSSVTGVFTPCDWPVLLIGPVFCQTGTLATAQFRWAPRADALGSQFLEFSSDGTFIDAGLQRVGPLAPGANSYQRGGFAVGQTYAFRAVWEDSDGQQVPTQVGWFTPECTSVGPAGVSTELQSSDDRLRVARLGINAPVNVRGVGFDGTLGVPQGAYDVVRYDFGAYPGLAGSPGNGGVTMIGGHVDFYSVGPAVFAPLRQAMVGDVIEYDLGGGNTVTYVVDWIADLPFETNLNPYLTNRGQDELILVTCNGTFDQARRVYDLRRLVHASRVY